MAKNVIGQHTPELTRPTSIKHLIKIAVDEAADKIAFKYRTSEGIKEVTFKEFRDQTVWLGTGLASLGQASGHIACIGENSYNWIVTYLTALQSEGVFCPIDKELPIDDLVTVINHGDDDVIFCDGKREAMLKEAVDRLPNIKYFICFDREEDEGNFLSFQKLMEKGKELFENGDNTYVEMETADMRLLKCSFTPPARQVSQKALCSPNTTLFRSCIGVSAELRFAKSAFLFFPITILTKRLQVFSLQSTVIPPFASTTA